MMNIWDLEKITGADIANTLEDRFMGSEELYVRFLKKLLYDESYMQLKDAAQYGDMKGVELRRSFKKYYSILLRCSSRDGTWRQFICSINYKRIMRNLKTRNSIRWKT